MEERKKTERLARLNFRPVLFCAFGLAFGIFLYAKIRFGGLAPSDFLFAALFLLFALFPLGKSRLLAVLLTVLSFAAVGVLGIHLYTERFSATVAAGEYRLTGTAVSVSQKDGYAAVVLDDLYFDGVAQSGKCRVMLGEDVRPADILVLTARVAPVGTETLGSDPYVQSDYSKGIRYCASSSSFERVGRSGNPFLRLNAALYDAFHSNMEESAADLSYALLTGNSGGIDEGLSSTVRRGGVAHIFAVSGLHIGILYSAVYFLCRPLKKYRVLPALALSLAYCALCNFTASSVRALIMCAVLSCNGALGRKHDFLTSVSIAALLTLLFAPQQWFSAGMKLSYGACLGLALFSGPLTRLFARLKFPRFLRDYLASCLAVQIFTLPLLLEAFGYFPLLGIWLNFVFLPLLPLVFLGTLLCAVLALVIPPAASVFLLFPGGVFSAFEYLISFAEEAAIVSGFALGTGAVVWLIGCVLLSERFRLSLRWKSLSFAALSVLFALTVFLGNAVTHGCRLETVSRDGENAVLVRTGGESVLILGDASLSFCEDLLRRSYGGELTAVVVLTESEVSGANVAAFLPAKSIRLKDPCETGLSHRELLFGESFTVGELFFRFETRTKLVLFAEECVVEMDFTAGPALGADLFVGEACGSLKFLLDDGIIKEI